MKLPLRYYGHADLRTKAKPIDTITPEIRQLAADMIETMIEHNGVGLAAPQVGQLVRMFIRRFEGVNAEGEYYLGPPEVILNPVLTQPSKETTTQVEGCLSVPGVLVHVERPRKIHLRYQNLEGAWIEEEIEDFKARVTMHENDHLNGTLHIDRAEAAERRNIEPLLSSIKKKHNFTS
ncbi:MAG: peptide deformylase [Chlamydiota bacterium]|jgi:peptide deformylase